MRKNPNATSVFLADVAFGLENQTFSVV